MSPFIIPQPENSGNNFLLYVAFGQSIKLKQMLGSPKGYETPKNLVWFLKIWLKTHFVHAAYIIMASACPIHPSHEDDALLSTTVDVLF